MPLMMPFAGFSGSEIPIAPSMTNFLTQFAVAREPNSKNGVCRLKSRYKRYAQAEPCHRVLTIGIKHRCACRSRGQPTIQVSKDDTRAWRSISWNVATRGAILVRARNPESPPLAEAVAATVHRNGGRVPRGRPPPRNFLRDRESRNRLPPSAAECTFSSWRGPKSRRLRRCRF